MKIKINYNVNVGDEFRRALAWRNLFDCTANPRTVKLASRKEIKYWYKSHGESFDIDIEQEYEKAVEEWDENNNGK